MRHYPAFIFLLSFLVQFQARAQVTTLNLNQPFPGDPAPAGGQPWVTVSLKDLSSTTVQLTFDANNLQGSEFVTGFYLNSNPAFNPTQLSFSIVSNPTGLTASDIQTGEDAFKSDGDGYYDILFGFPTSGSRFTNGETVVVDATRSAGLSVNDFLYTSTPGGGEGTYYSAAHVQGLSGGTNSTWIGATGFAAIPEPADGAAFLGCAALVIAWRRSRSSRKVARTP